MSEKSQERPVVVSTAHRGIFVGYTTQSAEDAMDRDRITLKRGRMIVYHSEDSRGFVGIGKIGPGVRARVSPDVPSITLKNLTGVIDAGPEAVAKWEEEPWK